MVVSRDKGSLVEGDPGSALVLGEAIKGPKVLPGQSLQRTGFDSRTGQPVKEGVKEKTISLVSQAWKQLTFSNCPHLTKRYLENPKGAVALLRSPGSLFARLAHCVLCGPS